MSTIEAQDELFNPLDPDVLLDPYPAYRRMREHARMYWHAGLECWMATRYDDCAAILRDADRFGADFRRVDIPTPPEILNLQTLDPPEHTPLRRFAMEAVRAQDLGALRDDVEGLARERLAAVSAGGGFDFASELAEPFTLAVISRLLGVDPPAQDAAWFRLNEDLDRSMEAGLDPATEAPGLAARASFNRLIEGWLEQPTGDGLVAYIARHRDAAGVSTEVLVSSLRAFWHAGFEVPSRFLGNAVYALMRHDEGLRRLAAAPSLDTAIEELVRFAGPVQAISRIATTDTELGGQRVRRGEMVVALIAAANRDAKAFTEPDRLVLDRRPNSHLGFGRGAHSCLGVALARIEAHAVLGALLRGGNALTVDGEPRARVHATIHGFASLPVRFEPRRVTAAPRRA